MTTLPIHTVQHVKSVYNKFQVMAVVFTAMTLLAALLAAVSGFQLARLRKMQPSEVQTPPAPIEQPAPADSGLDEQIKKLENQLQSEKTTSRELRARVQELEEKIAAMKAAAASHPRPAAENLKPPVKPKAPEVAPDTDRTPSAPAAKEGGTDAAQPKTVLPSVPVVPSQPSKAVVPSENNGSQMQAPVPALQTGSSPSSKSEEPPYPVASPNPAQPAAPEMEKDQAAPASPPAAESSPAESHGTAIPPEGPKQAPASEAGSEADTPPGDVSVQPTESSKSGSQSQ
jgi:hypothetical protein